MKICWSRAIVPKHFSTEASLPNYTGNAITIEYNCTEMDLEYKAWITYTVEQKTVTIVHFHSHTGNWKHWGVEPFKLLLLKAMEQFEIHVKLYIKWHLKNHWTRLYRVQKGYTLTWCTRPTLFGSYINVIFSDHTTIASLVSC